MQQQQIFWSITNLKIQEYVKQFAQIESPVADGTDVDWIRINWGDIYIFLYDNGSIRYQLDPHNGYGNELIDTFERGRFTAEILTLEEAPVARNGVLYYEEETVIQMMYRCTFQ